MKRFAVVLAALVAGTALLLGVAWQLFRPSLLAAADPGRGREVFWGRGACSSCHSLVTEGGSVLGPNLGLDLIERAQLRVAGLDAAEYLVQSLYRPEAYVVPGYPAGLMPAVWLPPLSLDDDDILAVLTYLWVSTKPHEKPPIERLRQAQKRLVEGGGEHVRLDRVVKAGDPARGGVAYRRLGCGACHLLHAADAVGEAFVALGPDLDGIGRYQSAEYLAQSVVDPSAAVVPGGWTAEDGHTSRMPSYRDVLEPGELDDLIAFLGSSR